MIEQTETRAVNAAAGYVGGMNQAARARGYGKDILAIVAGNVLRGVDMTEVPARIARSAKGFADIMQSDREPVAHPTVAPTPVTPLRKARIFNPQLGPQ